MLNLWCADGMRGVKLTDVQRVRFLNPVIESEFRKALETLALSHDTQKKAVSHPLRRRGQARRPRRLRGREPDLEDELSAGAGKKQEEKPYLQGWAVVENPTDEDWKDVRMALVSGRPISFQMDLYTPLYVAARRSSPNCSLRSGPSPTAAAWTKNERGTRRQLRDLPPARAQFLARHEAAQGMTASEARTRARAANGH